VGPPATPPAAPDRREAELRRRRDEPTLSDGVTVSPIDPESYKYESYKSELAAVPDPSSEAAGGTRPPAASPRRSCSISAASCAARRCASSA